MGRSVKIEVTCTLKQRDYLLSKKARSMRLLKLDEDHQDSAVGGCGSKHLKWSRICQQANQEDKRNQKTGDYA